LPGGRIVAPAGNQFETGPGPFGLALGVSGNLIVTANAGPDASSLTVIERGKSGPWQVRQLPAAAPNAAGETAEGEWLGVSLGVAVSGEHAAFVAEGNSGRVSLLDRSAGRRRAIDLNQGGAHDSFTGDLAFDAVGGFLYVADQANSRVAVVEARSRQVVASVSVGRLPFALALSPDRGKLYVTNVGMLEYRAIPGADARQARATGLPFPAFGFPSPEATAGAERATGRGPVAVPGVGDPNAPQSNSLCVVDVSDPTLPKVEAFIPTGAPFGGGSDGGSSPSGVLAAGGKVFVSNANDDSITVVDAATNKVEAEIEIRIPGFETLRGVLPIGMAYHEASGRLLVAEAGINAVAVIDVRQRRVLGHLPTGWFPTRVALDGDTVLVANAKGWRLPSRWPVRRSC